MQVAQSDSVLAWMLAHEVAHRLAGHTRERLRSNHVITIMALPIVIPAIALTGLSLLRKGGILTLASACLTLSPLPLSMAYHSRLSKAHEYEADEIGLYLVAAAGYDIGGGPRYLELAWRHLMWGWNVPYVLELPIPFGTHPLVSTHEKHAPGCHSLTILAT